jgi:preprotein translocase subunit SecA
MTQALTKYHALFESIRSRRRRPMDLRGVDRVAQRVGVRIRNAKVTLAWLRREAEGVDALGKEMRACSEGVLDQHIASTREVFLRGRQSPQDVRRALALTREVARRITAEEAYIVQIMGALALYHGRIIEMVTGEGKTLTGSLVAPVLAWRHRSVHILTVNDYLAARDAESRGPIYTRCLCGVGAIVQEMEPPERFGVYARSIVYGTPKQITADWLRDQIRLGPIASAWAGRPMLGSGAGGAGPMIPGLKAAMVDEADAVLIDEGVVPLIIARSRREDDMAEVYRAAAGVAARLDEGPDYAMDHLRRRAELKRRGEHRVAQLTADLPGAIWRARRRAEELVRQALVARHCYLRGKQYDIVDGRIVIVDEYTGRFLADRSWEHGLHQAVEAKESVEITADRETLARMSFQRFFRSYPFLCGMTGTAADATGEIEHRLRAPGDGHPDQPACHPGRDARACLPHPGDEVGGHRRFHRGDPPSGPPRPGGHAIDRGQRASLGPADGAAARAQGAQRELRQGRGVPHRPCGQGWGRGGDHGRDQHGRERHRHQA